MKKYLFRASALAALFAAPAASMGVVIDFAGGTAYRHDGTSVATSDAGGWDDVDYYEESGFRIDFVPNPTTEPFSSHIGNYYGIQPGNAVIHGHWETGDFGDLTLIRVTKIDNSPFDLNYFVLTSNTDTGGEEASGNERAFIRNNNGDDILLPSEDWGFPSSQIFLPATYDGILYFEFYVENRVDCFGMDEFYIDEPAPPRLPDGGSTAFLLATGALALAFQRKRFS